MDAQQALQYMRKRRAKWDVKAKGASWCNFLRFALFNNIPANMLVFDFGRNLVELKI